MVPSQGRVAVRVCRAYCIIVCFVCVTLCACRVVHICARVYIAYMRVMRVCCCMHVCVVCVVLYVKVCCFVFVFALCVCVGLCVIYIRACCVACVLYVGVHCVACTVLCVCVVCCG